MKKKHFYYNVNEKAFAIASNFDFKETPQGYIEITEEQFEALQNQLNEEGEENDNINGN